MPRPEELEVAILEAGRGRSAAVWFALISRRSDRRDGPRMLPYVQYSTRYSTEYIVQYT